MEPPTQRLNERVITRMTREDRRSVKEAARRERLSESAFARRVLVEEAERVLSTDKPA